MSMEKKKVSLTSCPDYARDNVEQAVERALGLLGGVESIAGPGQSVFVKSNAVLASAPETAMVTHPEVIRAVVKQLQRVTDDVTVGDSPGGPSSPATFSVRRHDLRGVSAAGGAAWAVGEGGIILKSTDGGGPRHGRERPGRGRLRHHQTPLIVM